MIILFAFILIVIFVNICLYISSKDFLELDYISLSTVCVNFTLLIVGIIIISRILN